MPKMQVSYKSYEPDGTRINVFGYAGTVCAGGLVVADVPQESFQGEVDSGRMTPVQAPPPEPEYTAESPSGRRGK